MSVFVDTSAIYALLDEDDAHHLQASDALRRLVGTELVTHTFIVVEASALVGRRLPWPATVQLLDGIVPVIGVESVTSQLFAAALATYRGATSSRVSLVDLTSFALMRSLGISRAFAYDDDFAREGFELVS
jgi:predicted nucleic acid-binding protein